MPFWLFLPFIAPNGAERQKQPIYASFFASKNGKIPDQKMMNFSILQIRDFLRHIWAYFGAERRQFSSFFRVT